ncbi:Lcl C-terminal domain-containing protein [Xanthomonas axonopodis]
MSQAKYIKIGADGAQLPADAADWVAVFLPAHGLTFTATSVVDSDVQHADCEAACKALTLAGHSDWDLPTIGELQLLVDRTRYSPAIDTEFFRDIQNDWYWSKTAAAWSSASAWLVSFYLGLVNDNDRNDNGFALAVRRAGQ